MEIARLLYPFLDGQLSVKDEYHCRLQALAERFALRSYQYKSQRRQQFEPAIAVLHGKPILAERYVLDITMPVALDGKDYVLVARRHQFTG